MDLAQGEKASLKNAFQDKHDYGLKTSQHGGQNAYGIEDGYEEVRHFEADEEDKLVLSDIERSVPHNITLSWSDITTTVTIPGRRRWFGESIPATKKTILEQVDGVVSPGSILAIMGPRGSGKSTLLNVLTSRNTEDYTVSGQIRLNGVESHESMKNVSAYVQQDDLFISLLTVREQLQFRALLKMDKKFNREQRLARAEEVIREVGLKECADTRIGSATGSDKGISGGERKRLSLACELLTNPPIFFCDEPTSGLDSFMAYEIIKTLQKMALRGRAVLCTIHQPASEVFAMFSQVLLLSEGRTAFMGPMDKALDFFASLNYPCPDKFNPADHFIITLSVAPEKELETRKRANAICDAFRQTDDYKAQRLHHDTLEKKSVTSDFEARLTSNNSKTRFHSSFAVQLVQLSWRAWIAQARNPLYTWMKLARLVVVSLFIGLTYLQLDVTQKGVQDISGALFSILINTALSNQFAVLSTFPEEMDITMRDYGSGVYGLSSYFFTKSFLELMVCSVDTFLFTTINYWLIGLRDTFEAYMLTCLVVITFSWSTVAMGYTISILCGRTSVALSVNTPVVVTLMLFGGFFLNDSSVPDYVVWIKQISVFKYCYHIMMSYQWKDVDSIECNVPANTSVPSVNRACPYRSGKDVLDYQKIEEDDIFKNFAILGAIFIGIYLLALFGLLIRDTNSYKFTFFPHTINDLDWNYLPPEVSEQGNADAFKSALKSYLKRKGV